VGRKNWIFVGSDNGAVWNTTLVSLIASCQMHNIEPWAYFRDLLTLLPGWPKSRALELSPKHSRATLARPETQTRLAELRLLRDDDDQA
jgi:transposase